jgi:hypothetical protein
MASDKKSDLDIWVILPTGFIISISIGLMLFLNYPQILMNIWDATKLILGPLVGAFAGVFFGFRKNTKHQEKINYQKKLLLLDILRDEVETSINLLEEKSGNLIPIEAWNSIVYSGNIILFDHLQATQLSEIYFKIKNYNYEAKRTRDASERFSSLAEPYQREIDMESRDHKNWRMAKKRWEQLSTNLGNMTDYLKSELADIKEVEWFNEVLRED